MSQIGPYKRPVFSWALAPLSPGNSYSLLFESAGLAKNPFVTSGSWTSSPAGFASATTSGATPSTLTFTWLGHLTGYPTFPYLGFFLEAALNNLSNDDNTYTVRWLFDKSAGYAVWTPGSSRDWDPKLLVSITNNEGYTTGTFTMNQSAPSFQLNPDYETTVDGNWLGLQDGVQVVNFATFPDITEPYWLFDHSPAGVWNPAVLSYGDDRSKSYSVGTSQNARFHTKQVTEWGERYERTMTLPIIHSKNMYAYRRINPLFEEDSDRRKSPNNLYECLTKAQLRDTEFFIWTELPDEPVANTDNYYNAHKGRVAKIMNNLVANDSGAWGFQGDDQRLVNVGLQFIEPQQQKTGLVFGF